MKSCKKLCTHSYGNINLDSMVDFRYKMRFTIFVVCVISVSDVQITERP